jgi:hypothetical protein
MSPAKINAASEAPGPLKQFLGLEGQQGSTDS